MSREEWFKFKDIKRVWKRNRQEFFKVVESVAGEGRNVTLGDSNKVYNVFVTYFLDQALHHEKAQSAHRFVMKIKVSGQPHRTLVYNMWMKKADKERKRFLRDMKTRLGLNVSSDDSEDNNCLPHQESDEKYFALAKSYLGEDLCALLKSVLRQCKVEFVAVQSLNGGKKMWINWEWSGASYHEDEPTESSSYIAAPDLNTFTPPAPPVSMPTLEHPPGAPGSPGTSLRRSKLGTKLAKKKHAFLSKLRKSKEGTEVGH